MVVLIVVAVACFSAGAYAAARWLPDLDDGPVGTVAFFVVCGLLGAALCLVGIDLDLLVRQLERGGEFVRETKPDLVGSRLSEILYTAGTLTALALVAYLLAPKVRAADRAASAPGDPST